MAIVDFRNTFRIQADEPIDSRFVLADEAARFSYPTGALYEGLIVYQLDTKVLWTLVDKNASSEASGWSRETSDDIISIVASDVKSNGFRDLVFTFQSGKVITIENAFREAEKGDKGDTGSTGARGEQGEMGNPGTPGQQGLPGVDGINGQNGTNGTDGTDGTDGAQGARGEQGLPGTPGTDGTDGSDGAIGLPGINGTDGSDGAAGKDGAMGNTGPAGSDASVTKANVDAAIQIGDASQDFYYNNDGEWVPIPAPLKGQIDDAIGANPGTNDTGRFYAEDGQFRTPAGGGGSGGTSDYDDLTNKPIERLKTTEVITFSGTRTNVVNVVAGTNEFSTITMQNDFVSTLPATVFDYTTPDSITTQLTNSGAFPLEVTITNSAVFSSSVGSPAPFLNTPTVTFQSGSTVDDFWNGLFEAWNGGTYNGLTYYYDSVTGEKSISGFTEVPNTSTIMIMYPSTHSTTDNTTTNTSLFFGGASGTGFGGFDAGTMPATFSYTPDTGGTVYTSSVTNQAFTGANGITASLTELANAITGLEALITWDNIVTDNGDGTSSITIDLGTETNIDSSFSITGGSNNAETVVNTDGVNTIGSTISSTITVTDGDGMEVTSFTSSVSATTDENIDNIGQQIADAVNNNVETPIDFSATYTDKVLTLTAARAGATSPWVINIDNNGVTGVEVGNISVDMQVQTYEEVNEIKIITFPDGTSQTTAATGGGSGDLWVALTKGSGYSLP